MQGARTGHLTCYLQHSVLRYRIPRSGRQRKLLVSQITRIPQPTVPRALRFWRPLHRDQLLRRSNRRIHQVTQYPHTICESLHLDNVPWHSERYSSQSGAPLKVRWFPHALKVSGESCTPLKRIRVLKERCRGHVHDDYEDTAMSTPDIADCIASVSFRWLWKQQPMPAFYMITIL